MLILITLCEKTAGERAARLLESKRPRSQQQFSSQ